MTEARSDIPPLSSVEIKNCKKCKMGICTSQISMVIQDLKCLHSRPIASIEDETLYHVKLTYNFSETNITLF